MSTQIAVRLPDHLVAFLDEQVAAGETSRAAVVTKALILTRERARGGMSKVTVAPITSRIRGLASEVPLGPGHGLQTDCVASCDNVMTVWTSQLGRLVGFLHPQDEPALTRALIHAFDLSVEELPR